MRLKDILEGIKAKEIYGDIDNEFLDISYDSREVKKGDIFFAIKGSNTDGHLFISDAVKSGAAAIFFDSKYVSENNKKNKTVFIKVEDSRTALAYISSLYYGEPSKSIKLIGITGTNGKTTTSYIIKSIIEPYKGKTGLIGTIQYIVGDQSSSALNTTPESPEFQSLLKEMIEKGCEYVISEVSSHALIQRRVDNTEFDCCLFTNLTRDHLDFHGNMENYYMAKKRLFTELLRREGVAVINIDDNYGKRLLSEFRKQGDDVLRIITYGKSQEAEVRAININRSFLSFDLTIECFGEVFNLSPGLKGEINLYNILAAFAVGVALRIPFEYIISGIAKLDSVKGRFESIELGQDFGVIIDYAHTDDALRNLIESARGMLHKKSSRIITVFGCGGDRDRGKRSLMGEVSTGLSDITIITSDNPRYEDPVKIIGDIEEGAKSEHFVEADRERAIKKAISIAEAGDIILIVGKGHERYQEISGSRYAFDDRVIAERFIKEKVEKERASV